jgi:preprotein translocase subunit SecD
MMTAVVRFNIYFVLLALTLSVGCRTAEQRRQDRIVSTFRLHLETHQGGTESGAVVEIAGAKIYVNNTPFLDETSVTNAAVVDTRDGGFAIQVQFDRHGTLILDTVTTSNRGLHLAIFSQFGPGKLEQTRWLAAPYIGAPIAGGMLIFTPNSTRAEADEVALGLRNVAKELKRKSML